MMDDCLDIVVINFNTKAMTGQCIDSLFTHTRVNNQIYVVDNGSIDGSVPALTSRFPKVKVIVNRANYGYARACNIGATAGSGRYIIFLNSDILALPNWDEPLLRCAQSDPRIAVVGPKLVSHDGRLTGAGVVGTNAKPVIRGWLHPDIGQYDRQTDCLSVCGAAYLIKRELIPVLGLFDERYFFYFEETDYSYNARDKGYRVVYCPASKMVHHHGQTSKYHARAEYFRVGQQVFNEKWRHMMNDQRVYG